MMEDNNSLRTGDAARDVLEALALRCEREEPSNILDHEIWKATRLTDGRVWVHYTKSLDAAMTLALGDWGVAWDIESVFACGESGIKGTGVCVYVWLDHPTYEDTFVRSPACRTHAEALAWLPRLICAAALRARAAASGEPEPRDLCEATPESKATP